MIQSHIQAYLTYIEQNPIQKIIQLNFHSINNKTSLQSHSIMSKPGSKLKNHLLLKDTEGKVKQATFELPGQKHTYGKKVIDDPEPIKYVVNAWKQAEPSQDPPLKHKNYKELNKISIQNKVLTAKQQQEFRKTNNIMVQQKKGHKDLPIMLPEEQFAYGVPNRPSTPVKLVIGNCYGLEKQQQNNEKYMRQTMQKQQEQNKKLQAYKTKGQLLREQKAQEDKNYRQKPNIEDKFKLSKYTDNSIAKVDTRLSGFGLGNKSQATQGQAQQK